MTDVSHLRRSGPFPRVFEHPLIVVHTEEVRGSESGCDPCCRRSDPMQMIILQAFVSSAPTLDCAIRHGTAAVMALGPSG